MKIPEPKFVYTKENLTQYAQERIDYIKSIGKYFNKNDEASTLKYLEKFEEHYPGIKFEEFHDEWDMLYNDIRYCKSDKIINKYLDIQRLFTPNNTLNGGESNYRGVAPLYGIMDDAQKYMSKDTFLKAITEFKRAGTSVGDYHRVVTWSNGDFGYFTSKRLQEGSLTIKDIDEIKLAATEASSFMRPLLNQG